MRHFVCHRLLRAFLFGIGLVGCSRQGGWRKSVQTVGDTTIIHTSRAPDAESTLLPIREAVSIGVAEGPEAYLFGKVTHVVEAEDGQAYIWDQQANSLRVFDGSGMFVRTVGRRGSGPGEYLGCGGLDVVRGKILFRDIGNGRINVYDTAGFFLTSWRAPIGTFTGLATDTAGRVYFKESLDAGPAFIMRDPLAGSALDTIPVPDLGAPAERLRAVTTGPGMQTMLQLPVPFVPEAVIVLHPHGYLIGGTGEQYQVHLFRPGRLIRIEREVEAIKVDGRLRDELLRTIKVNLAGIDANWQWNGRSIPDVRPFFVDLYAAPDGRIWVRRSVSAMPIHEGGIPISMLLDRYELERPETYDVFEETGDFLGTVVLPVEATFRSARGSHVWTTYVDSIGVPYVKRFDFRIPAS